MRVYSRAQVLRLNGDAGDLTVTIAGKGSQLVDAFLALGSNLGDRYGCLCSAIDSLSAIDGIEVVAQSSIYETKAVGFTDQPDFLNMAIRIRTLLTPEQLLSACMSVEQKYGRVREQKWGPRTLDIDVLFYGKLVIEHSNLLVPHPRLQERAFVVLPLWDLAPEWVHPGNGLTIQEMKQQVPGKEGVRKWERPLAKDSEHTGS